MTWKLLKWWPTNRYRYPGCSPSRRFCQRPCSRSIFIGIDGDFAPWVGALIPDIKQPLLLITPLGREEESIIRLARVGYDNTLGYLEGGFDSWKNDGREYDTVNSVSATTLEEILDEAEQEKQKVGIFDVRKDFEYEKEHVVDVHSTPLDNINDHLANFQKKKNFICIVQAVIVR